MSRDKGKLLSQGGQLAEHENTKKSRGFCNIIAGIIFCTEPKFGLVGNSSFPYQRISIRGLEIQEFQLEGFRNEGFKIEEFQIEGFEIEEFEIEGL